MTETIIAEEKQAYNGKKVLFHAAERFTFVKIGVILTYYITLYHGGMFEL
ncbi:MAG: hypothetical protein K6F67_06280 [Oscillospiraceae bacterium]|nr:hypothetical protein [Oscillospiraceae bacterium]